STKELRELPSASAALADVIRWPTGSIEVRAEEHGGQRQQSTPLRMSGPVDPLLSASSFGSDDRGEVTAFDGFGRQEWTIQIPARAGLPESHYVERRGHRAVLFLG